MDVIASQRVCQRPKVSLSFCREGPHAGVLSPLDLPGREGPSFLSAAVKYRALAEQSSIQSFIDDQKLPRKRKKTPLDMVSRLAAPELARFSQDLEGRRPEGARRRPVKPGFLSRLEGMPKKTFLAILGGGLSLPVLGCLFLLSGLPYIPDPDPPEDALLRNVLVSGFPAIGSQGIAAEDQGDRIPLDVTERFAWLEYKVVPGDTVEGIARRYGLSLDAVIASNKLRNVKREFRAGQKIRIPNMDGIPYTVKKGDSYAKIAAALEVPLDAILDANDIQSGAISEGTALFIPGAKMDRNELREALGELFIIPLRGRLTSSFGIRRDPFTGQRSRHTGQDIAAPMGSPVKASADGRVSATGYNGLYGNFVLITHAGGFQTMYGHLSRVLTRKGAYVNQGAVVGRVGNTGRSTGPHLHFSVFKNGRAINPLEVLNK
ncbi:MAG: M23 family metallopeptidase [Treponema sp.]|jgi:murein DD-endopeptidase MepM/ murein hydrolase activator NlpD|nr:M23 family metallopeptidase [Treponema sp.]